MSKDFFVMLFTQKGGITPLMENDDDIAVFETEEEAREAANRNSLGVWFGFEIFERGTGII